MNLAGVRSSQRFAGKNISQRCRNSVHGISAALRFAMRVFSDGPVEANASTLAT